MKIWETLYKVPDTEKHNYPEYYQPLIAGEFQEGRWNYYVRETHGWFDDSTKHLANKVITLSPQDGVTDFEEAKRLYAEQQQHRASEGFVWALSYDFDEQHGMVERRRRIELRDK